MRVAMAAALLALPVQASAGPTHQASAWGVSPAGVQVSARRVEMSARPPAVAALRAPAGALDGEELRARASEGMITLAQAPAGMEVAPAPGAVLRGLDKIAGAARDLEVSVGDSVTFGRLTITLTACRYPVGNPAADGFAHLIIHDERVAEPVFRGWMVAASPALNALDHPRFDVWLIRCTSP